MMYRYFAINKILVLTLLLLLLIACQNKEQIQPSSQLPSSAVEQSRSVENVYSEPSMESSESSFESSSSQDLDTQPNSGDQSQHSSAPTTASSEIQFLFLDTLGNPVQCVSGYVTLTPDPGWGLTPLKAKDNKQNYSDADGALYYAITGNEEQSQEFLVRAESAYDPLLYKEYQIDYSPEKSSYVLAWDLALPIERSIEHGIVIKVVDANGMPLEGIEFKVESSFLDFSGQAPGSGNISFTSPSDPNGIIILTPAVRVKSIFTYENTSFEIEYLAIGELIEKTVVINK